MTGKKRDASQFSAEERAKVVWRYEFGGESIPSLCKSLGISPRVFRQWEKERNENLRARIQARGQVQAELNRARRQEQEAASQNPMRIRDIAIDDVRNGKNWRVVYLDAWQEVGFPIEDLEIEPLDEYTPDDTLVYSGIRVYLKDVGEPRTGLFDRLMGRGRARRDCRFAPEDPKDLAPGVTPVVTPILMVKLICDSGWDYCGHEDGQWRQLGLSKKRTRGEAPATHEYIADPVNEDTEFDAVGDYETEREYHKRGFRNWAKYLQG